MYIEYKIKIKQNNNNNKTNKNSSCIGYKIKNKQIKQNRLKY